jgi:hypothetical protein
VSLMGEIFCHGCNKNMQTNVAAGLIRTECRTFAWTLTGSVRLKVRSFDGGIFTPLTFFLGNAKSCDASPGRSLVVGGPKIGYS